MAVYTLLLIVAIVLIGLDLDAHKADTHIWGWFVGGLFVLFSLPISFWGILQHVINYNKPVLQRCEIRIMWMVPIYAADAWLALRFPTAAIYLDTIRECYEAYVIYSFINYLLLYLWEKHPFLERELMAQPDVKLSFPFCKLKPWDGKKFLNRCKHGVLQYTVIRPITTSLSLICELSGVYHEGDFRADSAWPYLTFIDSVSQTWALYCLVLFYKRMKEDLRPMKPLNKFLCIKFVIFLSFWQDVVISILVAIGVIKGQADWVLYDTKKVAAGIQDFAICIEMFFAAIAHYFAFPHHPYVDETQEKPSFFQALCHMFKIDDVTSDVRDHVRVVGKAASRTFGVNLPTSQHRSYGTAGAEDNVPLIRYSHDSDDDSMAVSFDYRLKSAPADTESLVNFADFENLPAAHQGNSTQTTTNGNSDSCSDSANL
ncbi:TMEM184C [Bugula neritina]|uniref:TMEM184C n=1 Tax=Bugula neritina TaxID=10212 RepID=A0A7J7IWN8_BUGNE|nr:TMEM184C [Bugula neritina]